jgi:DNA-directed RNA polymerase specialized sigma24 family protein
LRREQFIEAAEKHEQRLYRFALLQTGSRSAASEILKEAFVACYRQDSGRGDAGALEADAFRAAFRLSQSERYAAAGRADGAPAGGRLAGLSPLERAAVVLTCFCRFSAREAAFILGDSADHVCAYRMGWLESAHP